MKKKLLYLTIPSIAIALFSTADTAIAQEYTTEFSESAPSFEEISIPTESENKIPDHFRFRIRSLSTTYGSLKDPHTRSDAFLFSDSDATLSYIFQVPYENILSLSLGYEISVYRQKKHLRFNQGPFNNGFFALGFQNKWFSHLTLQGETALYMNLERFDGKSYITYFAGYGRYAITKTLGINLGAIYRTGIEQQRAWPVAGFDWAPFPKCKLHFIYPIDIALRYHATSCLSLACEGRLINNRQRLNPHDDLPSGILQYRNYGLELNLTYDQDSIIFFQLGLGYFLDGNLSLANSRGNPIQNVEQNNIPFLNAQFALRF